MKSFLCSGARRNIVPVSRRGIHGRNQIPRRLFFLICMGQDFCFWVRCYESWLAVGGCLEVAPMKTQVIIADLLML